jgi:S1/P1 Nuclease
MNAIRRVVCIATITLAVLPLPALAWNIPGHMLSAAITYQALQQASPPIIEKVKAVLEKHPWYANQWRARLQDVSTGDHNMVLFMQGARWPDELRVTDRNHHRGQWHYINWPFKSDKQPASVQIKDPEPVNILTALIENERVVKQGHPQRKAIALAWLFHLVGDIHQPLHTAQLLTVDYPQGDRGGNEICVRVTQAGQPMDLHRFWDGMITSSQNLTRLRNEARRSEIAGSFTGVSLPNLRAETLSRGLKQVSRLRRSSLIEMEDGSGFGRAGLWIAQWSRRLLLPPVGYVVSASRIADRRIILAGYRLVDLLTRVRKL